MHIMISVHTIMQISITDMRVVWLGTLICDYVSLLLVLAPDLSKLTWVRFSRPSNQPQVCLANLASSYSPGKFQLIDLFLT